MRLESSKETARYIERDNRREKIVLFRETISESSPSPIKVDSVSHFPFVTFIEQPLRLSGHRKNKSNKCALLKRSWDRRHHTIGTDDTAK
jgi:hypothetical protein